MQNIRYKDTKMEVLVRSALHVKGLRFRKNVTSLTGKPDIVFPKYNVVVFLDSCFWHGCPYHANTPNTNKSYWLPKLKRNKERAREVNSILRKRGWKVIRIWEHQIKNNFENTLTALEKKIRNNNI